jgi:hypothetical protein
MTTESAAVPGTKVADVPARLERDYPAWHVWQSQAGRWWATRLEPVRPPADRDPGNPDFATTLDADTAAELRQALESQLRSFG